MEHRRTVAYRPWRVGHTISNAQKGIGPAERARLSWHGGAVRALLRKLSTLQASVWEVWNEIATTLRVPPEKLRPTDRFGEDIGLDFGPSDRLDTLSELAFKRAQRRQLNVRLEALDTIDDYVRALAEPA
jgi:hypothetical protein